MKSALRLLPLLFCLLLAACAGRPAPRPDQLSFPPLAFHVPKVQKLVLPNGIRLFLREDHELPLLEVTAMVRAGTIGDPAQKTGLGGIFATVLRTGGTAGRSPEALDAELEGMAADLSAASDTYATVLNLSLRADDEEKGLAILADILRRPAFSPQRLAVTRQQVVEGIRRENDQPGPVARRALMHALYGEHPLGRTPTVKTVGAVTRDDLVDYHKRFFHPNNLWLGISGDFDRTALLKVLKKYFGNWPQEKFEPQKIPPIKGGHPPLVQVATKDIPQTTILMGDLGIDKSNPDQYAVRVMNFILGGGGFNSRFMREIRSDRGLAYSTYSYFQIGRYLPGPFIAGCETKTVSTMQVVELMRKIQEGLRREPVTAEELQVARQSLINSFVFAFTDSHDIVTQTMRLDFYGYPPDYLETYRDRIAAVTAKDVLSAARKYLHPERQNIVLVGNESRFEAPPAALGLPVEKVEKKED
jgi:zinc protease